VKHQRFTLRDLRTSVDFDACFQLQSATWGANYAELVPKSILRLAQRLGGVAAGAFDETDRMVGLVFGIPGVEQSKLVHWSDMLAVLPEVQNQGLGEALKRYQRAALLERGVERMYWSFDPLEARNAYFNFVRLGIYAAKYVRDFYGDSASPLHRGIGTDRLIATWEFSSPRVEARLNRQDAPATCADIPIVNPLLGDDSERSSEPRLIDADAVRVAVPAGIQQLKQSRPDVAREWRAHTRAAFEHYLSRHYVVVDFVRTTTGGTYVLQRETALLS